MQTLYEGPGDTRISQLTGTDEIDNLLTQLERIAAELSWQPGDQIRAGATDASHLVGVVENRVAGGLQVIVENEAVSLPCRKVWPEVQTGQGPAAHVTILALEREYRGRPGLFWPLCVELWRWCQAGGVATLMLEATPATMRVYQRMGWPLEIVGDLRLHWGENCYLCRSGIRQMEDAIALRAQQSALYRGFIKQACRGKK